MATKECSRCGMFKALADFNRETKGLDGRSRWCRECYSNYNKARYVSKPRVRPSVEQIQQNARARSRRWAAKQSEIDVRQRREDKALQMRFCLTCADPLPVEMRADARFCSPPCRTWAHRKRHPRYKRAFRVGVERLVVLELDDGVCGICGGDVDPFDFEVDHIIPFARGGLHQYSNVQPAHPTCNRKKQAKLPSEMAA